MKKFSFMMATFAIGTLMFAFNTKSEGTLKIGDKAPMQGQEMENIDGKMHSLSDLADDNGLVVIFSCNTCPFVIGWEDTYPELATITAENKIGMVLINSNEAKRDGDDSMQEMKKHFEEAGYQSPYLMDENHKLADAFGAKTTPHVFLFDADMKLKYEGSINDKYEDRDETASTFYLKNALNNMVDGAEIDPATTKPIGCSIKRAKT